MAEEEQHETFEAVGSGASLTYPLQVSDQMCSSRVFCSPKEWTCGHQGTSLQDCGHVYFQDWKARSCQGALGGRGHLHEQEDGRFVAFHPQHGCSQHCQK